MRMRAKPILYNDRRPAEPIGIPAGVAHRIGARLLHEAREALATTIFLFVGFNFIVLTSNLLVAQYLVGLSNFMLAPWRRSLSTRRSWLPTICRY
jgi:hypothetical protein